MAQSLPGVYVPYLGYKQDKVAWQTLDCLKLKRWGRMKAKSAKSCILNNG